MIFPLPNNRELEVFNDSAYTLNSSDNVNQYDKIFVAEQAQNFRGFTHGIKIFDNEQLIHSCAVHAAAGATSVTNTSVVIEDDRVLLCCSNYVFCISLPTLDLIWNTETEWATAFQIFPFKKDYIVHGETEVVRIDTNGKIMWTFGGADIFVTFDDTQPIKMEKQYIVLQDFIGNHYRIDYNGQLI